LVIAIETSRLEIGNGFHLRDLSGNTIRAYTALRTGFFVRPAGNAKVGPGRESNRSVS